VPARLGLRAAARPDATGNWIKIVSGPGAYFALDSQRWLAIRLQIDLVR